MSTDMTMTLQEIYDKSIARIRATGRSTTTDCYVGVLCRYRGENGAACAVGAIIPDACYSEEMEEATMSGIGVTDGQWVTDGGPYHNNLALAAALNVSGIPATLPVLALLIDLQGAHDNAREPNLPTEVVIIARMQEVARRHGLVP